MLVVRNSQFVVRQGRKCLHYASYTYQFNFDPSVYALHIFYFFTSLPYLGAIFLGLYDPVVSSLYQISVQSRCDLQKYLPPRLSLFVLFLDCSNVSLPRRGCSAWNLYNIVNPFPQPLMRLHNTTLCIPTYDFFLTKSRYLK